MASSNPAEAARQATIQMYSDPNYREANTRHVVAQGYTPEGAASTYSQVLDRVKAPITSGTGVASLGQNVNTGSGTTGVAKDGGYTGGATPVGMGIAASEPLYKSLTANSTSDDIARAYYQLTSGAGGDTQANQQEAVAYLKKLGISDPMIESGYKDYREMAGLKSSFGLTDAAAAPTTEGILSGFKYANENGLDENTMKQVLGNDAFNTYKTGFADYAKTGIANILADKQLSFDEARTAVKFGRDYGYDAQKLADLTGTDKKVFDAIFKNYDDRTNQIVDSVLGAEDVKTQDDQVVRALALQQKFGFTDEDLAKATDLSVDQVKGFLNPVRNFETEFRKVLTNTDATTADIKKFAEDARSNGAVSQLYSKGLNDLDTKITELEDRWKDYGGVDPFQAQRVYDQLDAQRKAINNPNLFRGSFADPMKTAATLAKLGIDTLADIGQKEKFEAVPAEKRHFAPDGTPVQDFGNGTFGVADGEGGYSSVVPKNQVKTVYGRTESTLNPDGETSTSTFVEIPESEIDKDGNYQQKIGTVAIDKDTGKEIAGVDGTIDAEKSGRWNNRKRNELNVGFTKEGVPVLYSTQEKTGFGALVQDLAPIISMALPFVLPGVGAALSSGLASAGGSALATGSLANAALTQGILSGGMTALGGGQFEKGFLGGAVSPFVSSGISNLLPTGMNPDLAKAITGAGTGAVRGALQGNANFGDLLQTGILEGVSNYGLNTALGSSGLTPQQLNFATGIAVPLLQGEKVNPIKVFGTAANYLSSQPR